jgi:hypothetical protein
MDVPVTGFQSTHPDALPSLPFADPETLFCNPISSVTVVNGGSHEAVQYFSASASSSSLDIPAGHPFEDFLIAGNDGMQHDGPQPVNLRQDQVNLCSSLSRTFRD